MKKIGVINGLRGYAIIFVILHHLFWSRTVPAWNFVEVGGFYLFPFTFITNGWAGVKLFFMLSGFVLYLPYAKGTREMRTGTDAGAFYRHRAGRLLPLYYISVLFAVLFTWKAAAGTDIFKDLVQLATFTFTFTLDNWLPDQNIVLWSLALEVWFCVVFPLLVIIGRRVGLFRLFIFSAILGLAARFAGTNFPGHFSFGALYLDAMSDSLLGRLDDFVLGMLICDLYVRGERRALPVPPAAGLAAGLIVVAVGCTLWDMRVVGLVARAYTPLFATVFHVGFYLVITSLLFMKSGAIKLIFDSRPIQIVGVMSYSIYIWHQLAMEHMVGDDYSPMNIAVYLVLLAIFSALSYRYIEFGKRNAGELFLLGRR
ncbi:MAG: acyltransferase family protein [Thermodesulfobacteriota bacterium]